MSTLSDIAATPPEGQPLLRPGVPWRRYACIGAGALVTAAGVALLVLPGPGVPVLIGGLTLLGREVPAADRLRRRARIVVKRGWARLRRRPLRA